MNGWIRFVLVCPLLVPIALGQAAIGQDAAVTAAIGQPYSIASIEIPVAAPIVGQAPTLNVIDDQGRVLFPISNDVRVRRRRPSEQPVPRPGNGRLLGRIGKLIREVTGKEPDEALTVARRVTFLIRGDGPLDVSLYESQLELGKVRVIPQENGDAFNNLMSSWWAAYSDAAKRQIDAGDYPPWVENYLVAMLSGRTRATLPGWYAESKKDDDAVLGSMKLLLGTDQLGESIFRRAAAGRFDSAPAKFPLPPGPAWKNVDYPPLPKEVPIEPIASRVPPECVYIRYGSFTNFLWFRDLMEEYGGDLGRMVWFGGIDQQTSDKLETQLGLAFNEMTRLLGPTIIEDQALVGTDLFLGEGASMGVIIKAKNSFLLRTTINAERSRKAGGDANINLANAEIGGRTVTLLSSVDHRTRCFMAEDDGYFFFSNSETLVRRFFEVGTSKQSLASSDAFAFARTRMPLNRDDTIFAYVPTEMLQGLVAPAYLIELRRRLHAKSDIALVQLAKLAATAHGNSEVGINDLLEAGFLPAGFGVRSDGSGVIEVGDQVLDSQRGAVGTFLPIADTPVQAVDREELDWYSRIAEEYTRRFSQIDPLMVGLQRSNSEEGVERITVHAEVSPLIVEKLGWVGQQLGPPTNVSMQFAKDDIIAVQAHVESAQIGPATHVFAAVKDTTPPQLNEFEGILNIVRSVKQLPGYLGAWPRPGALDRLPLGLGRGIPQGDGTRRLIGGLYRYSDQNLGVVSFYPELMKAELAHLQPVDVGQPANVRARIGNLTDSKLHGWVNQQLYLLAADKSIAASNFLNLLSRQLQVPPDLALEAAERILGGKPRCALGGEYVFSDQLGFWVSSAWNKSGPSREVPAEYLAPVLRWFRGAEATIAQYADRLILDASLDVQRNQR